MRLSAGDWNFISGQLELPPRFPYHKFSVESPFAQLLFKVVSQATPFVTLLTMSSPLEYYQSLPPVAKTYAVVCLMTTAASHMDLYDIGTIALFYSDVFKRFQVWRLLTNFFFLGRFSFPFGFRILTILYYGVSLERGAFDKRTADYLWMYIFGAISLLAMATIPYLWSAFKGPAMVFMIVYVWSRENPNARVNIQGLVEIKGFYLPWVMLGIDTVLGHPWMPSIQGIVAGHIYYFCTVLYPLSTGKNYFKTPLWVYPFCSVSLTIAIISNFVTLKSTGKTISFTSTERVP